MNFEKLGATAAKTDTVKRKIQPNRHLQADADVFAYECCNVDKPVSHNWKELQRYINDMRVYSGAAHINLHLTMGLKGGREQIATVKPYQENRSNRDPEVSARVWELRHLMANHRSDTVTPVVNVLQEADDSLTQWQRKRIEKHGWDSSVIMSIDKDLWMAEGMHIEPSTLQLYEVKGYGTTAYREVGNVKPKLIGRGTSWFWHQMIMGDKADNIPGLPMLTGKLANLYVPTKKYNADRKPLACGEAKAVAMLKGVTSDEEACHRVLQAYQAWYTHGGTEMFMEQAFLLWMRRTTSLLDFQDWINSINGFNLHFTNAQLKRLRTYKEKAEKLL